MNKPRDALTTLRYSMACIRSQGDNIKPNNDMQPNTIVHHYMIVHLQHDFFGADSCGTSAVRSEIPLSSIGIPSFTREVEDTRGVADCGGTVGSLRFVRPPALPAEAGVTPVAGAVAVVALRAALCRGGFFGGCLPCRVGFELDATDTFDDLEEDCASTPWVDGIESLG
eukprot:m.6019 g.6019  ORF g.6019 m.6019 type:complete len:169 (-) comp5117_c1_seq1:341-847(-)